MTATTSTPVSHGPSTYTTERKKGGEVALSVDEQTALGTASTVRDALAVCSTASKRSRAVTERSIGKATSELA